MHHKKVKTEPCLSPESPFMRKPSKQFLQKLTFNKNKPKDQDKNMMKSLEYFNEESISKISFIPCGTAVSIDSLKNNPIKLKKTTIDLQKFKIRHENLLLKTQQQELRQKNTELMQENKGLRKQVEELRKQLQSGSRISKLSGETLEHTDADMIRKKNTFTSLGSHQSLLQIDSYQILPTTIQISHVNSLVFDDQMKCPEQCNFLSTSIGKKLLKMNKANKQNNPFSQKISYKEQIQLLQSRTQYLEKELEWALIRQKELEDSNKRLMLSASMAQRKLDFNQSELKQIKRKFKQKNYEDKLYQLSSQQDHQGVD